MTRILWIVGLSIALFVFSGFVVVCLIALVTHRHLNPKGWAMLVIGAYTVKFIFGWLRSAIKYGDPTKAANPAPTS
jgi:hypothetical protein